VRRPRCLRPASGISCLTMTNRFGFDLYPNEIRWVDNESYHARSLGSSCPVLLDERSRSSTATPPISATIHRSISKTLGCWQTASITWSGMRLVVCVLALEIRKQRIINILSTGSVVGLVSKNFRTSPAGAIETSQKILRRVSGVSTYRRFNWHRRRVSNRYPSR
jgi:hypothetical protein